MSIRCGNRPAHHGSIAYHETIESVRLCYGPTETWSCSWLVPWDTEDGPGTRECGALSRYLPDGRGWACEHGHDHIYAEVCAAEGWDYAADPQEAGLLAGRGVRPVAMDGGHIEIDQAAMAYAASL
jgi:hypothetical protein